jgi:3-hydroxy-9,10-secoandrosta-1,3,5(10)-triene-9,17-dione monooxygenase reductase component
MDKDKLAPALGSIAGGLYIVSIKTKEEESGFLASWVQQAGFEPPMLTIAFNKSRKHHLKLLDESGFLVLHIMGKENSKSVSNFFKAPEENKGPFYNLDTRYGEHGTIILNDSVAYLICKKVSSIESSDHIIVLLEVITGEKHHPEQEAKVHYRIDGFKY